MDSLIPRGRSRGAADKGYVNEKKKQAARTAGVYWAVKEKPKAGRRLSSSQRKRNRRHGAIRAKVEHVFRAEMPFGHRKVRYRGIAKNGAQVFSLLALANPFLARRTLAAAAAEHATAPAVEEPRIAEPNDRHSHHALSGTWPPSPNAGSSEVP